MDMITRGQKAGVERRGAGPDGSDTVDAFTMNLLRGFALVLGVVLPIGNAFAAADSSLVTCDDGKRIVHGNRLGIDAYDDRLSNELMRNGVEVGAHLHVAIGTDAIFAPGADWKSFGYLAATFMYDKVIWAAVI